MKIIRNSFLGLILCVGLATTASAANTYMIDTTHSTVGFSVKHLTVSTVPGNFKDFSGTIFLDPAKPTATMIEATIETKSINTNNEKRDTHLRSADFFDADANPTITFKSTSVTADGNTYNVSGDLTIKGVSRKVMIPMELSGPVKSPMNGNMVIGLSKQTKINRQDYGVKWSKQMDTGGLVVGDDVMIHIDIEAHEKPAQEKM